MKRRPAITFPELAALFAPFRESDTVALEQLRGELRQAAKRGESRFGAMLARLDFELDTVRAAA